MKVGALVAGALVGSAAAMTKERPVSKVIKILEEMQVQLEGEAVSDKKIHDKMECWCKTTKEDTEASNASDAACISSAEGTQADKTGVVSEKTAAIKAGEQAIEEAQNQLSEAIAQREKEEKAFTETQRELTVSIQGIGSALTVLKKHQSFLQTGGKMTEVSGQISEALEKYTAMHEGNITPTQRRELESFIQQPSFGAYSSQSGEIFGILESMKDNFTQDLDDETKGNAAAQEAFQALKASKTKQIKTLSQTLADDKSKKAQAATDLANAEAEFAACTESLQKGEALLAKAAEDCDSSSKEFAERTKARNEELAAVAKALEFLDSDEAHALFGKALGFMQVSAQSNGDKARNVLLRLAESSGRASTLVSLAQKIKAGVFDKVIHAIDDLVKEIKATMAKDVADKDACVTDINNKEKSLAELNNKIAKEQAKVESLESQIASLESDLKTLAEEVAALEKSLKEAGEDRESANAQYQEEAADQSASIKILNQALTVLGKVYGAKLLQQPAGFKAYDKNAGGNTVLNMIQSIISDAEKELALAHQAENQAQKEYEGFVQDTNTSIEDKNALISEKTIAKAEKEEVLQQTNESLGANLDQQEAEKTALDATKESCDFLLKNFAIRQEHMQGEIDALGQAKGYLNGMQ